MGSLNICFHFWAPTASPVLQSVFLFVFVRTEMVLGSVEVETDCNEGCGNPCLMDSVANMEPVFSLSKGACIRCRFSALTSGLKVADV